MKQLQKLDHKTSLNVLERKRECLVRRKRWQRAEILEDSPVVSRTVTSVCCHVVELRGDGTRLGTQSPRLPCPPDPFTPGSLDLTAS